MRWSHNTQLVLLFLIGVVILTAGLGLRDPWPSDEPRYALVAKEMVESGSWLIPRVGGVLYPDKPPMFFWAVSVFFLITGSMRVAIFMPSLLAGIGVLWLVTDLARRLWNPQAAIWTGATLLAIVQFPLQMKGGQIDGLLCFWTTLGLYGFSRHLLTGPDWRWYTIAGLAGGFGVITKGVGFLPFLIFIPYAFATRGGWPVSRMRWNDGRWLFAPLAFLLAIAVWLAPMLLTTSGTESDLIEYRDNILLKQTVTRFTDAWGHLKPPWYLFTNAIPWLWLPVTFLLPWLFPAWWRDLKSKDPTTLLLGGWIILMLLFFSVSEGKRSVYIFPAAPALALIAGHHISRLMENSGPKRVLFGLSVVITFALLILGVHPYLETLLSTNWSENLELATQAPTEVWSRITAIGLVSLLVVGFTRVEKAPTGFAAVLASLWIGVYVLVYPLINDLRSGRVVMEAVRTHMTDSETLGFADWKEQFLLQWDEPAIHFGYRRRDDNGEIRDAAAWLSSETKNRLLLSGEMTASCFDPTLLIDLGLAHRQQWYLAHPSSVLAACNTGVVRKIYDVNSDRRY